MKMPEEKFEGFIETLNQMGYMQIHMDPYSQELIDFCPKAPGPFLDIGTAYGQACLAALEKGVQVVANDLDENQLGILWERTPENLRENLKLLPGKFPDDLGFEKESFGAILISRVLHFFTGPQIEASLAKLYSWLRPGGKLVITVESCYLGNWQKFIPVFEERKRKGDPWPGFVDNVYEFESTGLWKNLPSTIHLFDPETLQKMIQKTDFQIEKIGFFARPLFPKEMQLDGRESVGAILQKE